MDLANLMDNVSQTQSLHVADGGDRLVAIRLADDWSIGLRLHRRGSHRSWNVREIAVRPGEGRDSIGVGDVRDPPLGALIQEARRLATKSAVAEQSARPAKDLATLLAERGGKFGSADDIHAVLAYEYVSIVETGERAPSRVLEARFGGAVRTWTNRVGEARRRGYLSPVTQGEAGGGLTEKALVELGIDVGEGADPRMEQS